VDKGLSKEKKAEFEAKGKPTCDFLKVVVFGKQADNCVNYLKKGSKVLVEGSINVSMSEKNGEKRYYTDINATNVEFLDSKTEAKPAQGDDFSDFAQVDEDPFLPF
jgi:single-strand DNA-binding protein